MGLIKKIEKQAKGFFVDAGASHDWSHTQRVYALCMHIADKEKGVDKEVLGLAAILHDIGRKEQDEKFGEVCHAEKGAISARKILKNHGFNKDKTDKIVHCIAAHRFMGNKIPETIEAKILFDADKLEGIGAVGIGRSFHFAGQHGAALHIKGLDVAKSKAYTIEDTAYREFALKSSKIKDRMLTKEGKRIAKNRHKFMEDFFKRLDKEVDGEL